MKKLFAVVLMIMVVFTYQNVYAEDACLNEGTNMLPERSLKIMFECEGTYPLVCSGAQPIVVNSMESEEVIPLPVVNSKDGPIFRGWYADKNFTTRVDTEGTEQGDYLSYIKASDYNKLIIVDNTDDCASTKYMTTLYAKFDYYTRYTLSFDMGGAKEAAAINFCGKTKTSCIEKDITLPTPTREGYKFAGWYADKDFKTAVNIKTNYSADLEKIKWTDKFDSEEYHMESSGTIYAKWNKIVEVEDTSAVSTKISIIMGTLLIILGIETYILVKE